MPAVRFWGGPLDGTFMEMEELPTFLPVWLEPMVEHHHDTSVVTRRSGTYQLDGLPNQPPYVYSWRD